MKKRIFKILSICLVLFFSLSLASCKDKSNSKLSYIVNIEKTDSIGFKDIYTIYYSDGRTEEFSISNGVNGTDGKPGINGVDGKPGLNGMDGKPGINGTTPHIGENGNWFIGDKDTGISAVGSEGEAGKPGLDGKPGENDPHYGETFNITYSLNGGHFKDGTKLVETVSWGDTIDLPIPYKLGYEFKGWYTGTGINDKKFTSYDAVFRDLNLTAIFEKTVDVMTCQEANTYAMEHRGEKVKVEGIVKEVHDFDRGTMTICDETGELYIYTSFNTDGTISYSELKERPYKGDRVLLEVTLGIFNSKPEGQRTNILKIDKDLIKDTNTYYKIPISKARSSSDGTFVELSGTIAFINYGWNRRKNGYYLVDGTDSIYVSDGENSSNLKVGNKVTIRGEKHSYFYPSIIDKAQSVGYTGSTQIKNATLVENDDVMNEVDLSFAKESTITELINKPYNENYRTKIYKVRAIIKKDLNSFSICDLDGKTGSIVYDYSRCNIFAYLDKYEGEIVDMYISVISLKFANNGIVTEFITIQINGENQPTLSFF